MANAQTNRAVDQYRKVVKATAKAELEEIRLRRMLVTEELDWDDTPGSAPYGPDGHTVSQAQYMAAWGN